MNRYDSQEEAVLTRQLMDVLEQYRRKPYLPVWGELFFVLRRFKQLAAKQTRDLVLYPLQPSGELMYKYLTGKFVVRVPELNLYISMELEECVDSLISGRFQPAQPSSRAQDKHLVHEKSIQPGERSDKDFFT
ncbi:MAG: hypothetical protein H0Z34_11730 [Brevibacillus sp.]|nr:hypothetical protein [Brevibacillus sp.]